jgi:hypothetical protein
VIPLKSLPEHMRAEVGWWRDFLARRGCTEQNATPKDAARFALEVLAPKSLASRVSCINALAEYHQKHVGGVNPFKVNPWPYPLLTRWLPASFGELFDALRAFEGNKAHIALILVCRASVNEVVTWNGTVRRGCVVLDGRCVPVTDEVASWLSGWVPPTRRQVQASVRAFGYSVADMHGALSEELIRLRVHETMRAAVYGRWSAMRYAVAEQRVGFFGTPLPGSG